MEDPVVPFDLTRMFLGTDPALFYLEIVFRTLVIYIYSLLLIRWVGGRGIAQMSVVEFLLVIALGSAVGDAMFYPEVPLFHAMLVITCVVAINKGLDILIFRFKPLEKAIDGGSAEMIVDGVIDPRTMRASNIGKNELFESLREQGYVQLGEVRRAYLESSGRFSFFRIHPPRTGLPIEPPWDVSPPPKYGPGTQIIKPLSCCECGMVCEGGGTTPPSCPRCGGTGWTPAVVSAQRHS
ncbi:MAG: DUF421 domain-containing protein [Rhodobacterales bacterium]|nr:DUF421 domain-containing protein [Rhodobacterales bacterium]